MRINGQDLHHGNRSYRSVVVDESVVLVVVVAEMKVALVVVAVEDAVAVVHHCLSQYNDDGHYSLFSGTDQQHWYN